MSANEERGPASRPPLAGYQRRVIRGTTRAIERGENTLIEAPTGSGKTAILAGIAQDVVERGGKALILTHRKALFRQMAGDRSSGAHDPQDPGQIAFWSDQVPGTIGESRLGGIDQSPGVVVAMVETAAARLDELEKYSAILIDEVHHASAESDSRDLKGAYARIIDALPEARLVGVTATTFRGDRDDLMAGLEEGHQEKVSVEEARAAGRIRPAKTIIGQARLACGRTPWEVAEQHEAGVEKKTASIVIRDGKTDEFYEHVASDWKSLAGAKQMIIFTDRVAEADRVIEAFNRIHGEGVATGLHGGRGDRENQAAIEDYSAGRVNVLVSCKMIEEGFDVPSTSAVASVNASLSRQQMNQYVGRALRATPGEEEGIFLDYGTASHRHGKIEKQHELQNLGAWAALGTSLAAARTITGAMPETRKFGDHEWRVMSGERRTLFLGEITPGRFLAYELRHDAQREMGRRAGRHGGTSRLHQLPSSGESRSRPHDLGSAAALVSDFLREEAGNIAREDRRSETAAEMLASWGPQLEILSRHSGDQRIEVSESPVEAGRAELVRASILDFDEDGSKLDRRVLAGALEKATPADRMRESVRLLGVALGAIAEAGNGVRAANAEMAYMSSVIASHDWKKARMQEVDREGRAILDFVAQRRRDEPLLDQKIVGELAGSFTEARTALIEETRKRKREQEAQSAVCEGSRKKDQKKERSR